MKHQRRITLSAVKDLTDTTPIWDSEVKGFGAQRNRTGTVTFFVKTRINGRQRWTTIGRMGSPWTPETARREALDILAKANAGVDVGLAKKQNRDIGMTFETVADRFRELHGVKVKPRTRHVYKGLIEGYLKPAFKGRRIDDITKADVALAHARWHDKPRNANHTLSVLSKLMNWAEDQGYRPENTNPCRRIDKYRENCRERYLTADELRRLGAELDRAEAEGVHDPMMIAAIRLLVFTGARLNEILGLRWDYVDWERAVLRLPDSKTGAKTIPLNGAAISILKGLPRLAGNPHVLPGRKTGDHLKNVYLPWNSIRARAELGSLRLHDLRHSFASMAVNTGESLAVLGKVLGHNAVQTTARYAHIANDPAAALSERVGQHLAQMMNFGRPMPAMRGKAALEASRRLYRHRALPSRLKGLHKPAATGLAGPTRLR